MFRSGAPPIPLTAAAAASSAGKDTAMGFVKYGASTKYKVVYYYLLSEEAMLLFVCSLNIVSTFPNF